MALSSALFLGLVYSIMDKSKLNPIPEMEENLCALTSTPLAGSATIASVGLLPMALLIAAMFFTSLWFTFRDSFSADAA